MLNPLKYKMELYFFKFIYYFNQYYGYIQNSVYEQYPPKFIDAKQKNQQSYHEILNYKLTLSCSTLQFDQR